MKTIQMHAKLLIWKQWSQEDKHFQPILQLDYLQSDRCSQFFTLAKQNLNKRPESKLVVENLSRTKICFMLHTTICPDWLI